MAICGATTGPRSSSRCPCWFKELELIGSTMATHAQFAAPSIWWHQASGGTGRFRPRLRPLPDALRRLESGEQLGKVVLAR